MELGAECQLRLAACSAGPTPPRALSTLSSAQHDTSLRVENAPKCLLAVPRVQHSLLLRLARAGVPLAARRLTLLIGQVEHDLLLVTHLRSEVGPLLRTGGHFGALWTNSVIVETLDREVLVWLLQLVLDLLRLKVDLVSSYLVGILLHCVLLGCKPGVAVVGVRLWRKTLLVVWQTILLHEAIVAVLTLDTNELRCATRLFLVHGVVHRELLHVLVLVRVLVLRLVRLKLRLLILRRIPIVNILLQIILLHILRNLIVEILLLLLLLLLVHYLSLSNSKRLSYLLNSRLNILNLLN